MKEQRRTYPLFSLCGLNCGLCPMYHISETNHCTGCGGKGRPSCKIIRCSEQHGNIEYCYLCEEYPCERYTDAFPTDSFITYRNVLRDFERAKNEGLEHYQAVLNKKVEVLRFLLKHYNDGRRKSFFCLAVNLLELEDIQIVVEQIAKKIKPDDTIKEQAALAVRLFKEMAEKQNIDLKLKK